MTTISTDTIVQVLERYWGFREFRPWQREAIRAILDGRDSVLVLPTGGGKSLCFQAPALLDDGTGGPRLALVVSPLIALMKDQVDGLVASGVPAACLNSAQAPDERSAAVAMVRSGACRLLYVSPERLVGDGSENFREWVARAGVRFIAIDEAHCISQWGHDFRPEYRLLGRLKHDFAGASIHAFTATATVRVRDDMAAQLGLRDPVVLVGAYDRANLTYRVVPRMELRQQIQKVLARHPGEAGIVYCLSRREVDDTAGWLQGLGVRALAYHAGMTDTARRSNQEAFIDERADVVVATVAFGMGIDRPDVRFVIHAGTPRSLEHYQQESGRAGRDGLPAECVLIASPADFLRWKSLLELNNELSESNRLTCARWSATRRLPTAGIGRSSSTSASRIRRGRLVARVTGAWASSNGSKNRWWSPARSCRASRGWASGLASRMWRAVLRGDATEAVSTRGHQKLSTFGLLRECPWRRSGGTSISSRSRACSRGLASSTLRCSSQRPASPCSAALATRSCIASLVPFGTPARRPDDEAHRPRQQLPSARMNVRSSTRCARSASSWRVSGTSRRTSSSMTARCSISHACSPARMRALLRVPGVGEKKAESLGDRVLAAIRAHGGAGAGT